MADFDPRQLDELEDALELLDHVDELDELELAPELSERLAAYRDVLALCRDAFPLEQPDDRLLTDVIAEAHEVSRRPRLRDVVDGDRSAWRVFWERWRGTLAPGFALAGTAAAMLWLLDPQDSASSADELLTKLERPDADRTQSERTEQTQPASDRAIDEPTRRLDDDDDDDDGAREPVAEQATGEPSTAPPGSAGIEPSAKKSHKQASKPALAPAPAPTPEPMTKDEAWAEIGRGDAARRGGDCDRARSIYDDVIAASPDKLASARAKAGVGLCFEQDRRDSAASEWFDAARATSPGIDSWINQQRDELVPHKSKRAAKAEPDAFEADALEEAL